MIVVRIKGAFALSLLVFGLGLIVGYYIGVGEMSEVAFQEGRQEANSWRDAQQRCAKENQKLHLLVDPLFGRFPVDPQ